LPYIYIAAAAALWGGIGIFVHALDKAGFSSLQIVALRVGVAAIFFMIYIGVTNPALFRIKALDSLYFVGTGILSISFFNWCYFTAIQETSLSVAVILLYTGPAFVVILSRVFFNERFTVQKLLALLFTLVGSVLVVELLPYTANGISAYGILVGLGAGFGYALYSIFGKSALEKYSVLTILFYTFLMASIAMIPVSGLHKPEMIQLVSEPHNIMWISGIGIFPTVLAYLLYTRGLSKIEAGKASITAMMEPIAASLIGIFLFGEILTLLQVSGILLVLFSVVLIQVHQPLGRFIRFNSVRK